MWNLTHVPSLEQLTAVVAAASTGSMGAAARQLGVSQQAVSARITAAEALFGFAVLRRSSTGVSPTGQGQLVLAWAHTVLDAAHELEEGVTALRTPGRPVSVAASNTISEALLPLWASQLRRTHPDTSLQVFPGNSQDVIDAVDAGRVDLGFVETSSMPRGLGSRVVAHDELVVVVPPEHPWTRRRGGIDRGELSATPLILREPGSGTRDHIDHALPGHAPALHTFPSTAAVRDAVATTGIPTILSSLAIAGDLATGRLRTITVRDLSMPRTLHAIWHPRQRPRGAAADLLRIAARSRTGEPPSRLTRRPDEGLCEPPR